MGGEPGRPTTIEHDGRLVTEVLQHPPEARGDPPTDIVIGDDEVLVTDAGRLETPDEGGHLGEWMPSRPDLRGRREIAIDVEMHRARDVSRFVGQPPIAGPAEVPAAVDDPDRWVVEARGEVVYGDERGDEDHAASMPPTGR